MCVLSVSTGSRGREDWALNLRAQDLVLALSFQLCLKSSEKLLNEPSS